MIGNFEETCYKHKVFDNYLQFSDECFRLCATFARLNNFAVEKITSFLKNKYKLALAAFFIWILFFDSNNLISQFRLVFNLHDLKKQKAFYLDEIKKDSTALYVLRHDTASLEKFARENYLMKRDNEDIFLIVEDK